MANKKITDLAAISALADADISEVVDDVAGTPTSKKVSGTQKKAWLKTYFDTLYAASGANADITSMTGLDDNGIPVAKVDGAITTTIATDPIFNAAGDLVQGTGNAAGEVLSIGAANLKAFVNAAGNRVEWAAGMKLISTTHDISTTGNQDITGFGFQPGGFIIWVAVNGSDNFSVGFAVGSERGNFQVRTGGTYYVGSNLLYLSAGDEIAYVLAPSYLSDGIRLTWAKISSPTGIAKIKIMGFR